MVFVLRVTIVRSVSVVLYSLFKYAPVKKHNEYEGLMKRISSVILM